MDIQSAHQHFSTGCFNEAWSLLDRDELSVIELEDLVQTAHASYWHWSRREDATPQNMAVGAWQLSRVYAVAGRPSNAVHYGQMSLELARSNGLAPFFTAYAYEALARAAYMAGRVEEVKLLVGEACREAEGIESEEDRNQLLADLATIQVESDAG